MLDARLILEERPNVRAWQFEITGHEDPQTRLAHQVRQEGVERGGVAAVTIDDQHALKAMSLDASEKREQHRTIGRDVETEGAAERHVMFRHAAPHRRGDYDRYVAGRGLCARAAHTLGEDGIDADRKMRPVLLHRTDRPDNDHGARALGPEVP